METPSTLSKQELIAEAKQAERQIKDSLPEDPKASDVFEGLGCTKITVDDLPEEVRETLKTDVNRASGQITPFTVSSRGMTEVNSEVEIYQAPDGERFYFVKPDEGRKSFQFAQLAVFRRPTGSVTQFQRRDFVREELMEDMVHECVFLEKAVVQAPREFEHLDKYRPIGMEPLSGRAEIEYPEDTVKRKRKKIFGIF